MMKDPNVASLGAALSRALQQAGTIARAPTTGGSPRLVPVQNGDRGTPPVICIPGAGGNAASFAGLAAALGEAWAVYGGQPRGLDGAEVPHSTVPAAARAYLAALEASCPDGPVHLLGHSFGGWIAFEMAQRLRACGRDVASLTLIDSDAPGGTRAAPREFTRTEALMKLVELWELAAERPLGLTLEDLAEREAAAQLELLHARLVRAGLMPRRSSPEALTGTVRTFATALRTGYEPAAVYPAPVRLVLLPDSRVDDETNQKQIANAERGWRTWAPDLDVWHGPGDHMTVLKAPHATVLADWLRAKLRASCDG